QGTREAILNSQQIAPTRLAYFPLIVPRVTCGRATTARLQVNQKWRSIVRVVSVRLRVSLWVGAHPRILPLIKVGKVGSNPLLINGFFEHGRRGRMTIFWIFLVGTLTALLCHSLLLGTNYPRPLIHGPS